MSQNLNNRGSGLMSESEYVTSTPMSFEQLETLTHYKNFVRYGTTNQIRLPIGITD